MVSAGRDMYADARPFERAYFPAVPESLSALESKDSAGSDLGSNAFGVNLRVRRRPTACACCLCSSLASAAHDASSRGIQLLGNIGSCDSSCDSVNAHAQLL